MVAYILNFKRTKTASLTDSIIVTAEGNPLYINEILSWMHNSKLLNQTDRGEWEWDDDRIRFSKIPNSTIALFSGKIKTFSPEVIEILQITACLGTFFLTDINNLDCKLKETNGRMFIPDDLPIVLEDKTLLGQIFSNLLNNSLTYYKKNIIPEIKISWSEEAEKMLIHVSDNGIGIPAESHENFFNMFQRLHRQEEYPGTGIGLALVKKAVEMLMGEISLVSKVGKGSSFTIKFDPVGRQKHHGANVQA